MKPQEVTIRIVVEGASDKVYLVNGQDALSRHPEPDGFEEVKGKSYTKSQLLRFALRRKFKEMDGRDEDFEPWYDYQMERIIGVINKKR